MAKIVNMQAVAVPLIHFDMGDGRVYRVNGKMPVEQWLTLAHLEQRMIDLSAESERLKLEGEDDEALRVVGEDVLGVLGELCDMVLAVLRVLQPELEECPFDEDQIGVFLATMRESFFEAVGPDPTQPSPETAGTAKTPANRSARRKSTPSSGSRASRSSSAGRRITGTP